jgi:hypothetical protein
MLKPHRVLASKLNSYADEASAFMRRRRHERRSYIRIQFRDGNGLDLSLEDPAGKRIRAASQSLIDRAG